VRLDFKLEAKIRSQTPVLGLQGSISRSQELGLSVLVCKVRSGLILLQGLESGQGVGRCPRWASFGGGAVGSKCPGSKYPTFLSGRQAREIEDRQVAWGSSNMRGRAVLS